MTMAHIQPPKMMAPRPAIASVTPEAIRSWSLPMDTLGDDALLSRGRSVGIGGRGQTNRHGEETLEKGADSGSRQGSERLIAFAFGERELTESDEPASAARCPREPGGFASVRASASPRARRPRRSRRRPGHRRAPKPTLPLAPPQTCRGPSPVRPCPSVAPWHFTFASGTPRDTGVHLATPRDRDAAGTTTPAVAACSMATISREFVSALVR